MQVWEFSDLELDGVSRHDGQKMVEQLQQLSIDATLITDAAIFAIMPRVHRVLLGPQSGRGFGRYFIADLGRLFFSSRGGWWLDLRRR